MTNTVFTFTGTDGTDLTTGNSGASLLSGQAAGQDTAQFSSADGVSGTGVRFTNSATGSAINIGRWNYATGNKTGAISLIVRTPAVTTPATVLVALRSSTGRVWQLKWDTATGGGGRLLLIGSANENNFLLGGSQTVGLAVNTKYRIEAQYVNNASAAGGTATFNCQIYDMSDTLLYSYNATPSGDGNAISVAEVGCAPASAAAMSVGYDNLQLNDGATTAIGKLAVPAPVVTGSVTPNLAIIDATATTGATPLTYVISPTTGVTTISTGKFAVPTGVTYTITATDPGGQSGSNTFVVAPSSGGLHVRTQIRVGGVWTTPVGS